MYHKRPCYERPIILEALCGGCGEIFIPIDDNDLIHLEKEDGTECGAKASRTRGYFAQTH